jgi:hypothetical protein
MRDAFERARNNNPALAAVVHRMLGTRAGTLRPRPERLSLSHRTYRKLVKDGFVVERK